MLSRSRFNFACSLALLLCVSCVSLNADPIISVQPSALAESAGDNFSVSIVVTDVTDLYAFQFDLGFDPGVIAADGVAEGSFLSGGGSTFFIPGTIDNVGGSVSNNADTLLTAVSGVTGSGTLATFQFTAIGSGSSSVDVFNLILLDSSLSEISPTVQNGSVTVGASSIPEPSTLVLLLGAFLVLICRHRRSLACLFLLVLPLLCMGQSFDTTPPTLVGFSFSPSSVNVTAGPQTVTVTLNVTDDLSGVLSSKAYVAVEFQSPSGKQFEYANGSSLAGSVPLNASFQAFVPIPQFSESGNWTVFDVSLSDAVGNTVNLDTTTLASMFFPTSLTVVSNPDVTPPTLASLKISPSSVNVSAGPQPVTVSLGLTDAQSGVSLNCPPTCAYVLSFTGPSGNQFLEEASYNFQLASGTANAGVWNVTVNFPQYAEAGLWTLQGLNLRDAANNEEFLTTAQIKALGFPTTVLVSSAPTDNVPPALTSFSISPLAVDTSTGPQTITLSFGLTDNLSGVDFTAGFVSPNFNQASFSFTSQSGQQYQYISPYSNAFTMDSGSLLNGQWQTSFVLPQYSEGGTWTIQQATFQDTALNLLFLNAAQLLAMSFPATFVVFVPSLTPDGTVNGMGGTVDDTVFGSRASLTFPPGEVSGSTTVAIDVLSSPLAVPTPAGFSVNPASFFTNIQLNPEPAFPLPAPGLTLVLPLVNPLAAGMALNLYRIDPISGVPVPAQNTSGANIQGTVDASGLSATFTGISRLSTAVAYLPLPGKVLGDVNGDGKVNCADIAIVKAAFGKKRGQPGYNAAADVNNDGVIDIRDLTIVSRQLPKGMTCR